MEHLDEACFDARSLDDRPARYCAIPYAYKIESSQPPRAIVAMSRRNNPLRAWRRSAVLTLIACSTTSVSANPSNRKCSYLHSSPFDGASDAGPESSASKSATASCARAFGMSTSTAGERPKLVARHCAFSSTTSQSCVPVSASTATHESSVGPGGSTPHRTTIGNSSPNAEVA